MIALSQSLKDRSSIMERHARKWQRVSRFSNAQREDVRVDDQHAWLPDLESLRREASEKKDLAAAQQNEMQRLRAASDAQVGADRLDLLRELAQKLGSLGSPQETEYVGRKQGLSGTRKNKTGSITVAGRPVDRFSYWEVQVGAPPDWDFSDVFVYLTSDGQAYSRQSKSVERGSFWTDATTRYENITFLEMTPDDVARFSSVSAEAERYLRAAVEKSVSPTDSH